MKILIQNYTFDKTAKTVTFTDYGSILLERILLITNVTRNTIIYNFADATKGGTVATNVLTLAFDTSAMANTDKLQIFYDDGATSQAVSGSVSVSNFPGTQPVSGTVAVSNMIAAVETGLAKDATLTGGTVKSIVRGGAKGTTTAADVTSQAIDANQQGLDVILHTGAKGTTVPADITSTASGANHQGVDSVIYDTAGNAWTPGNVSQINGVAPLMGAGNTGTGSLRVTLATDQATLTNPWKDNIAQINGVTPLMGAGNTGTGSLRVTIASDQVAIPTKSAPTTTGGLSIYTGSIGATATAVKASAGQVYGWYIFNANTSTVYVQLFNTASGSVTLGTTPPVMSLGIPAGAGANVEFSNGIAFGTAISVACTTTRAGSTGPTSTVDLNILYA